MKTDGYDWRHGWVPVTMKAALMKTRGNREAAAALLAEAREGRRRRREARGAVEFRPPVHNERAAWAGKSDDDLAVALADADERTVARIVAELDRRDASERKVAAQRARRQARYAARDKSRERKYDELLAYWQTNGRLTVDDFRAGVLGGAMRSAGTAAFA